MRPMPLDSAPQPRLQPLTDPFGRMDGYLRVSVTDRCDFRRVYCMPGDMTFPPKAEGLALEGRRPPASRGAAATCRRGLG
jgi:hypothetical protein